MEKENKGGIYINIMYVIRICEAKNIKGKS